MTDTIVCGIDPDREWLLHVIAYDSDKKTSHELMWFFHTRTGAEVNLERIASRIPLRNAIVKIVKIRSRIRPVTEFEHVKKEED